MHAAVHDQLTCLRLFKTWAVVILPKFLFPLLLLGKVADLLGSVTGVSASTPNK